MPDPTNPDNFTEKCPYCQTECTCDVVDVGVGLIQSGPYHCNSCGATEAGAYDDTPDDKARIDPKTGWFPPGELPGSSANMVNGKLATVKETRAAYHQQFAGNPLYDAPGVVETWFRNQREKK